MFLPRAEPRFARLIDPGSLFSSCADGGLDVFFGGLEALLGPPQVAKDPVAGGVPTIRRSLEIEHTESRDSTTEFRSSNGCTTTSANEWSVAYAPEPGVVYPEREGFRENSPQYCRKPKPISSFFVEGGVVETAANARLRAEGHTEVILEEVLAGRLYTGPMCTRHASATPLSTT